MSLSFLRGLVPNRPEAFDPATSQLVPDRAIMSQLLFIQEREREREGGGGREKEKWFTGVEERIVVVRSNRNS